MAQFFSRKQISIAVSTALGVAAVLSVGGQAVAQQAERVTITGSNIPRAQTETASPILTINREDIEKSGKANVAEYLQTLSVDSQGSVPASFGNGFAPGSAGISLRGLGAASTLVLVNGRRIAPYGLADDGQKVFTDLSIIPLEVVDRVEILKDGASAIYGSDAIAGVVNIILRQNFRGTVAKASYGRSRYNDGDQTKASITHGFGDYARDGFNAFFNLELLNTDQMFTRDRNRDWIGKGDLRPWGYDIPGAGFQGGYIVPGAASTSPAGNVRNPATGQYQSLPGCAAFSSITPPDPAGGCLWDVGRFRTLMPSDKTVNLFGRGTWKLSGDMQAYAELGYSKKETEFQTNPTGVNGTWGYPGGVVATGSTTVLGATHPDNPFGAAARLRYSAWDVGPRINNTDNEFTRLVAGLKGTWSKWDWDASFLHSQTSLDNARRGFVRNSVVKPALGDPASPYFPYRIGINAGLNPASLYAAMSPVLHTIASSKMQIVDLKASRDLTQLAGGPMVVALGAEYRREETKLDPTTYTDIGDIVGLGYSAYDGKRNITAAYAELLAPVSKMVELSAAVRTDRYPGGIGTSTTPKLGAKITPVKQLALRGTYAEGFRAPNAAESGTGGLAAFTTTSDPVRCPGGTPAPGASSADCNRQVAIITTGNPSVQPEKSKSFTLGAVWDPLPSTSFAVDFWKIKRTNEINQMTVTQAVAGGGTVTRSDDVLAGIPNSGTLLAVQAPYLNSNTTEVKGTDIDFRQRFNMGEYGRLTFELRWTHLSSYLRTEKDGTQYQWAGTHGNCDVTNCIGTPKDRVNMVLSWDKGNWRVAGLLNYRGALKNVYFEGDECGSHLADGSAAPAGCKIKAFYTVDLSARWQADKNLQVFGSIQNLLDKVAPLDPLTYGAISYNPLDVSGAIGRFYTIGARYQFR